MTEAGVRKKKADRKVEILTTAAEGDSCVTFKLNDEDHTLGNALRYIIMKNPDTEFCGYTVPHPSDECIKLRIQTRQGVSAVEVFKKGLRDLEEVCKHVDAVFTQSVADYKAQ
eukprot:comp25298_c0_seq1/m.46984 comp25298_c0_seq1/g.46984  ORF comp25298_c0_seq1/g.46984 comp25298_c0_seq1/m.46984 type:complete len:113 (-) comp25298_c0_seq1:265-603(-)